MATFAVRRSDPVFRKEDCSPFDIGLAYFRIATFADGDKFRFIQNIWKPDTLYKLPVFLETGGKLRKFKHEWLLRFPWLTYSNYVDGVFCLPCLCFGLECGKNGAKLDKLFNSITYFN